MTPAPRPSLLPVFAAALTLLLWASAFVAIRHLHGSVPAGALSLGRLVVGAAALAALMLARRAPRVSWTRGEVGLVLLCGATWFGIYNLTLNESEHRIDAATAAMLVQVGPLLVAVLAATFLGESITRWLVIGMAVSFSGVVVIGLALGGSAHDLGGVLLALVAAATYAVGVVTQKLLLRRHSALEVVCWSCVVGAVVCLPWSGQLVHAVRHAPTGDLWLVVALGLLPTALAFTTWAYALSRMDASRLSITTFLVPAITAVMAWVVLAEVPPFAVFVGGALCIAGVLVARRRQPAKQPVVTPPAPVDQLR